MQTSELIAAPPAAKRRRGHVASVRKAALAAAAVFAGLQFIPLGVMRNPPSDASRSLAAQVNVPPDVGRLLTRACMDCHSNQTRWPWYSRVAPVSFLIARDVSNARASMNFSDWDTPRGVLSSARLMAACAMVRAGRMPKPTYLWLHPEARLTGTDRLRLCEWADEEMARAQQSKAEASRKRLLAHTAQNFREPRP